MAKYNIQKLILLTVAILLPELKAEKTKTCMRVMAENVLSGQLFNDQTRLSGNFINELGNFRQC